MPPKKNQSCGKDHRKGFALLAVLWLVAALSIAASAILYSVRSEIRASQILRQSVQARALADAAIRTALQKLTAEKTSALSAVSVWNLPVLDVQVPINVIPLNGRINLNAASASLLEDAFKYLGELPDPVARKLAEDIVSSRTRPADAGKLHAREDLFQFKQIDYDNFAKITCCVTADMNGDGIVNPLVAHAQTLKVLAKGGPVSGGTPSDAMFLQAPAFDATTLARSDARQGSTSFVAIRAKVPAGDGRHMLRTWHVDLATGAYGLPWRVLSVEENLVEDNRLR